MKYTLEDLEILATLIGSYFKDTSNNWILLLKTLKDEYKNLSYDKKVKQIILEILGPYCFGFNEETMKLQGIYDFIYSTPLNQMPLYISSGKGWESIISKWRLSIEK